MKPVVPLKAQKELVFAPFSQRFSGSIASDLLPSPHDINNITQQVKSRAELWTGLPMDILMQAAGYLESLFQKKSDCKMTAYKWVILVLICILCLLFDEDFVTF